MPVLLHCVHCLGLQRKERWCGSILQKRIKHHWLIDLPAVTRGSHGAQTGHVQATAAQLVQGVLCRRCEWPRGEHFRRNRRRSQPEASGAFLSKIAAHLDAARSIERFVWRWPCPRNSSAPLSVQYARSEYVSICLSFVKTAPILSAITPIRKALP